MDCTSNILIMKSNTSVFLSLLSQGVLNTLKKGITTFVDYLTCLLLLRLCLSLFNHCFIIMKL